MKLAIFWIILTGITCFSERRWSYLPFAIVSLLFLAGILLIPIGDPFKASLLAAIIACMISGASAVKYHHSGLKLAVSDLALTFSGTLPFMLRQYRRTAIITLSSAIILIGLATLILTIGEINQVSIAYRLLGPIAATLLLACTYCIYGGAGHFRPLLTERAGFLSSFMASLLDIKSWWRTDALQFIDIADDPLMISDPSEAGQTDLGKIRRPDIMVVQHESVFDPRIFDLPIGKEIERFFSPPDALGGTLKVEIYGGGSWQTEFSLLTGLSSRSFGPDSYFLFKKGAGRFRHSLPNYLSGLGYRTTLIAACRRNFMDYEMFYQSIGVQERVFIEDFLPPFDIAEFEKTSSDAMFMEAASRTIKNRIADDSAPRLTIILTNFNHGPHTVRQVPQSCFEAERKFATNCINESQYAEYYSRLAETAASWNSFRSDFSTDFPDREAIAIRYGDHQPVMTRRIEAAMGLSESSSRHLKTFYAIEGINTEPSAIPVSKDDDLDIAFLGTMTLQAAGIPLDSIYSQRLNILPECMSDYFASSSETKLKFHRWLAQQGMVDCTNSKPSLR